MNLSKQLSAWSGSGAFIEISLLGLRVFYQDFGEIDADPNETCLLVHGFPESSFSFHKVIEGLQHRFRRVVVVDMPGYGLSDKPGSEYSYSLIAQADAIMFVYRELGITGGHVICHDMGTSVVTEWLARYVNHQLPGWFSDSFKSVTFTNGSMVLGLAKLRLMQKLLLKQNIGPLISKFASYPMFAKTILSAHGAQDQHQLDNNDLQLLWENVALQDGHKKNHLVIRYLIDRHRFEGSRWLPSLPLASKCLPIHFCWGNADQVARIEMARYLHQTVCPDSTLTEMQDVGHFCQLASPEVWLDSVLRFYEPGTGVSR